MKLGARVYGVSFDKPEKNLAFKNKQDFQFPLWSDTDQVLAKAYGAARALGVPYAKRITVLIDPEGVWRWHYPKVSPGSHPGEVLADLRAIIEK